MKIYIGSDHAGYELKKVLKKYLEDLGNDVFDKGPSELNPEDDYPDFIAPVAKAVSQDKSARGIVLGGSGQGEGIVANRFPGIRCTVYYGGNEEILRLSREHNDANMLSLSARFMDEEDIKNAIKTWLSTHFSHEERHERRIKKIDEIEK
jgi:ribose 5-phosphate isomerase B